MKTTISTQRTPPPPLVEAPSNPKGEVGQEALPDSVDGRPASHGVRLPHGNPVADPQAAVRGVHEEIDGLLRRARAVVAAGDGAPVDVHRLLMSVAKQTRLDQQGGLEQAQTTIDTNRRLRDQIFELVAKIQEELQALQEEIADLKKELDDQGFFGKAGEKVSSAFGGGKNKSLQKKQANMTIEQGRLKEAEARLESAKKLIEHGHELMETSVQDLKKIVERINASIQLVKQAVNAETQSVGRA